MESWKEDSRKWGNYGLSSDCVSKESLKKPKAFSGRFSFSLRPKSPAVSRHRASCVEAEKEITEHNERVGEGGWGGGGGMEELINRVCHPHPSEFAW